MKVSLTGLPLLVCGIVATLLGFAGTVFLWRRGGRWRLLSRTGLVLLCEALAVFTGAVATNRALDLYPSWATLFQKAAPPPPQNAVADPATSLDVWLKGRAADGARKGLYFDWKPTGLASWHLAAVPTVFVPAAYFTSTALQFPVVVVAAAEKSGPAQAAWDDKQTAAADMVRAAEGQGNPAIVVFVRTAKPDTGPLLATELPTRLDNDLRVAPRGWAAVGIGADAPMALTVLGEAPGRYRAAVAVADGGAGLPATLVAKAGKIRADQSALLIAPEAAGSAALGSGKSLCVGAPASGPALCADSQVAQDSVDRPQDRLPAALRWTFDEVPAPLAPPITGPVGTAPAPTPAAKK